MTRSFSLIAAFSAACLAVASAARLATEAIEGYVDRAIRFVVDILARPNRLDFREGFGGFVNGGPTLAYDGPNIHELRHEAGVSRRSAARNV